MWPWFLDESQQTLVIAILGFIGAFVLTHYFFSFRTRGTVMKNSNSYDELIESLLSQYSGKFVAITKIIETMNLRLELLERVLEQRNSSSKSEVAVDKSRNLSLLSNSNMDDRDSGARDVNVNDMELKADITKSYHEAQVYNDNGNYYNNVEDTQDMTGLVLKLLSERSMSTTEIQNKVNRTREHTSRFMKRLFLEGLVSREMNTKPFVYTLTDEGHKQLKVFRSDV